MSHAEPCGKVVVALTCVYRQSLQLFFLRLLHFAIGRGRGRDEKRPREILLRNYLGKTLFGLQKPGELPGRKKTEPGGLVCGISKFYDCLTKMHDETGLA